MTDRMTMGNLVERCKNLNRRMEDRGSIYRYSVQGRSGYIGLDRERASDGATVSLVRIGTKREIGEYLLAMMTALDDASYTSE